MNAENLFTFGAHVMATVVKGAAKTILVQLGDAIEKVTEGELAEWWQHVGFISIASNPDPGKSAAETIAIRRRDRDMVIASRDQRGQLLKGELKPGETMVYAGGPDGTAQGRQLFKADGSITIYTRAGNSPTGGGMTIQVDAMNDAIRILNSKGYGIIIDGGGARITTGGDSAGIQVGADGSVSIIATKQAQVDGATVLIGSTAIPVVNAALKGPTGIAGSPSLKVLIE